MALVAIPDFTASAKPLLQHVRDSESAIMAAVGGWREGNFHPGGLDAANFAADPSFQLSQVAEPRHRVMLGTGRSTSIGGPGDLYGSAKPFPETGFSAKCIVVAPFDVDCDAIVLTCNALDTLKGVIGIYRNGARLTEYETEIKGHEAGDLPIPLELPFAYSLTARTAIEVRLIDGDDFLLKTDGTAPPPYTRILAQLWGVAAHAPA